MDCSRFGFAPGSRADGGGAIPKGAYAGRSGGVRSEALSSGARFTGAG